MSAGRSSGTMTVLFTDLVGSTELMARLGEDAYDEVRAEHFAGLREVLAAHRGTEVKNTGDGLMATFASAANAVAASVAMQQAASRHARSHSTPLTIRVGLALGDATLEDGDVFGLPVVEAARLVSAARPGQILATVVVRVVSGSRSGAAFADLGALELKGLAEPVPVCEVAWEPLAAAGPVPLPPLLAGAGRIFVGRAEDLGRLRQLWKAASAGERRVGLLGGEPGVGKTRLAAELAATVHGEGAIVLAGRCDEDLGVPYQPFVEALRHSLGGSADVGARLGRYGGELARLVPELTQLVPGLPEPLRSDPETERYRLFDAVAAWLADLSREAPVLLVLDDLQWAAKPTLLLLRHVLCSADVMSLLVVATYRDTELSRGHPLTDLLADLRRQTGVERIPLVGLDTAGVAAYMAEAAGHDLDDEAWALAQAIHTETEGNPFFIGEVLRHLAESGGIVRRDGRWTTGGGLEELGIPEGVREVVGRRLSRLSEPANQALGLAAVVGLEFELAVVQALAGLGEDDLLAALDEATSARLVSDVSGSAPRYRFAHTLVRATLYEELSPGRRVVLHRRVAEVLETLYAAHLDDHLPAIAHHYARAAAPAALTGKAVDYARRAGDRALVQLAHDEAAGWYRQALDLLAASEDPPDDGVRLRLLLALGEAQRRAGDPAHRQTLLDAAHLAESRGDADSLAQAALANTRGFMMSVAGGVDQERVAVLEAAVRAIGTGDRPERARLLATLALEIGPAGRDRGLPLTEEALALARRLADPATLALVLGARFYTLGTPDTLVERRRNTEELVATAERLEDPALLAWALWQHSRSATEAADVDQARADLEAMEGIVADLGQPLLCWYSVLSRGAHRLFAGELEEAERLAAEATEIGRITGQPDLPLVRALQTLGLRIEDGRLDEAEATAAALEAAHPDLAMAQAILAFLAAEQGRLDDARARLDRLAASDFTAVAPTVLWLYTMAWLAAVAARLEDRPRAAALQAILAPHAGLIAGGTPLWIGSVSHYLGLLATTLERFDEAEAGFARAAQTHERVGAPAWLARTRLEWARMLLRRGNGSGDGERARELLHEALSTARDLGIGGIERQAVALLGSAP